MRLWVLLTLLLPLAFIPESLRADTIQLLEDYNQQVVGSDSAGPFGEGLRSVHLGSKVFFEAISEQGAPKRLWVTDGSRAGTKPVPGLEDVNIIDVTVVGDHAVLLSFGEGSGTADLWVTNGLTEEFEYVTRIDAFSYFGFEIDRAFVDYTPEKVVIRTKGSTNLGIYLFDINTRDLASFELEAPVSSGETFTVGDAYVFTRSPSSGVFSLIARNLVTEEEITLEENLGGLVVEVTKYLGQAYLRVAGSGGARIWSTGGSVASTREFALNNIERLDVVRNKLAAISTGSISLLTENAGDFLSLQLPEGFSPTSVDGRIFWSAGAWEYFLCRNGINDWDRAVCRTDLAENVELVLDNFPGRVVATGGELYLVSEHDEYSVVEHFDGETKARKLVLDGSDFDDLRITSWLHEDTPHLVNAYNWYYGVEPWSLNFAGGSPTFLADINPDVQTKDIGLNPLAVAGSRVHARLCCGPSQSQTNNFQTITSAGILQNTPPADTDIGFSAIRGANPRFDFFSDYAHSPGRHAFGISNVFRDVNSGREYSLPYYRFPTDSTTVQAERLPVEGDFVYLVDLIGTLPTSASEPAILFRSVDGDELRRLSGYFAGMIDHRDGFLVWERGYKFYHYKERQIFAEFTPCSGSGCGFPKWFNDGEGTFLGLGEHPGFEEEQISAQNLYYYDEALAPVPRLIDFGSEAITDVRFLASTRQWTLFAGDKAGALRPGLYRIEHRTLRVEKLLEELVGVQVSKVGKMLALRSGSSLYVLDEELRVTDTVDLDRYMDVPLPGGGAFFACHLGYCYVSGTLKSSFPTRHLLAKVNVGDVAEIEVAEVPVWPRGLVNSHGNDVLFLAEDPLFGIEIHKLQVFSKDTDGDGIYDAVESSYGLDPNSADDADQDADADGLSNLKEFLLGTELFLADSDRDGLSDGVEVEMGFEPLAYDTQFHDEDSDGLSYRQEAALGTDYQRSDTDGDGFSDKEDRFPLDAEEWADENQNGIGDNQDNASAPVTNDSGEVSGGGSGGGGSVEWFFLLILAASVFFRNFGQRTPCHRQGRA